MRQIQPDVRAVDVHVAHAYRAAVEVVVLEQVQYRVGEHDVRDQAVHLRQLAVRRVIVDRAHVPVEVRRSVRRRRLQLVTHRRTWRPLLGTAETGGGRGQIGTVGVGTRDAAHAADVVHRQHVCIAATGIVKNC